MQVLLAPRNGYLPSLESEIRQYFNKSSTAGDSDTIWFDYQGLPLKWLVFLAETPILSGVWFQLHFRLHPFLLILSSEGKLWIWSTHSYPIITAEYHVLSSLDFFSTSHLGFLWSTILVQVNVLMDCYNGRVIAGIFQPVCCMIFWLQNLNGHGIWRLVWIASFGIIRQLLLYLASWISNDLSGVELLDLEVKELHLILSYTYCSHACIILTSTRLWAPYLVEKLPSAWKLCL